MHFYDVPRGNFGGDGIVGGHLPLAAGMGYGIRLQGTDQVVPLLLRRRRRQRGRLPRGAERERAVGPARRLHHREQPLRHGHGGRPRLVGEGPLPARPGLRHPPPRGQRHGPHGRARGAGRGHRPRAQGEAADPHRGRDLPLPRPLHVRPRQVPHEGRSRADDEARPHPRVRAGGSSSRSASRQAELDAGRPARSWPRSTRRRFAERARSRRRSRSTRTSTCARRTST